LLAAATKLAEDGIMPDWIAGPVCAVLAVGVIFHAFRQAFAVKPDQSNGGVGPTTNDQWLTSGRWSKGGHFF
jgi:hypothetical protein